ncbi:MAG: glycoside hydrolase family 55 protein [Pseudomonadota bacterium]|nr:glycoside hydrolase family 55 protein [Pseudomonadota bacterium]
MPLRPARRPRRLTLLVAALVGQFMLATGCRAQSSEAEEPISRPGLPAEVRTLKQFGAVGDGRTDDTQALMKAFHSENRYCLDGGGATYRVVGTVEVGESLCLRNATLLQGAGPVDTSRYINARCPAMRSAADLVDCGDPVIPPEELDRLLRSLSVRTLFVHRSDGHPPIKVTLENVKIDRGRHADGGSRIDSAGIWVADADRVDFRNVEITGHGKGFGLLIAGARNVTLNNLAIHDLVWAPYRGDRPLVRSEVAAVGWNSVPIREIRAAGQQGAAASKFYGVRIQEQVTCASLVDVQHVRIENVRIERCMARFDVGNLPWQADGLNIGHSSRDVIIDGGLIESTWEGLDVTASGTGIEGLVVSDLAVRNSFGFGVKLGNQLRGARLSRLIISKAGIAGMVVYGPVSDAVIRGVTIEEVGLVRGANGVFAPWGSETRAGIRIDEGSTGESSALSTPRNILIENASVTTGAHPSSYEFGIFKSRGADVRAVDFKAQGFGKAQTNDLGRPR